MQVISLTNLIRWKEGWHVENTLCIYRYLAYTLHHKTTQIYINIYKFFKFCLASIWVQDFSLSWKFVIGILGRVLLEILLIILLGFKDPTESFAHIKYNGILK